MNYIAEKIIECFEECDLDNDYIESKKNDLVKHESKYESLAWCYKLDSYNKARLAEKIGVGERELRIAIDVMYDI
jgi:hypothetical protein